MNRNLKQTLASFAAASAVAGALPAFAAAHDVQPAGKPQPVSEMSGTWTLHRENVLGTSLDMAVSAPSQAAAHRAEAAALAEFARQGAILSAWDASSEFSRWQRTRGVAVRISPELMNVLVSFDQWRNATGGVLNASAETATQLWHAAAVRGSAPSDAELTAAAHSMAQPHWALDTGAGTATRLSDAPLVLASFTKSLITSHAADAALQAGGTGIMLNVGGDIVTRGSITQRVDIADAANDAENTAPADTVTLQNRTIATSGASRRGFRVGAQHLSHLIDPRTARTASAVLSASVIASDPATAGALATALAILTPREGQALIERYPGAQYLLLMAEGERIASPGWAAYQEPKLQPVSYAVHAGAAIPTPGANWNQSMELQIKLDLPRMDNPRYRRPYVAVWIEDKDKYPVRTVALWFKNPRWLADLRNWYRDDQVRNLSEGTDISATVSSPTRAPGSYTLKWDGKDNEGKLVKAGKYTVVVEAAREHGGHSVERQEFDFNGTPQAKTLPASDELGAVALDYRKH